MAAWARRVPGSRRRALGRLALLAALALAGCGGASGGVAEPAERAPLRVGSSGDYPPFSELAGGERRGFDVELARAFARDSGRRLVWVPFRWPELPGSLLADRFDLAMSGVTVRPERSIEGRFSLPVARTGAVLIVRAPLGEAVARETPGDALTRLDVPSLRVAVNAGGHLERVTRARFRAARVRALPDNDAVPASLAAGEVDAVVTDTLEAPHWLARLPGALVVGPFTGDWKAYWLRVEDAALARELDAWLIAREGDGTLAALRARWFGGAGMPATAAPLPALLAACDERLALMPYVAGSKRQSGQSVVDPEREARVMAAGEGAVARAAASLGRPAPDPAAVRRFYRAQIDAAVDLQRRVLAAPPDPSLSRFDLARELRPALIRIGDRMAELLVRVADADEGAGGGTAALRAALSAHGLSHARLAQIAAAIDGLRGAP